MLHNQQLSPIRFIYLTLLVGLSHVHCYLYPLVVIKMLQNIFSIKVFMAISGFIPSSNDAHL